MGRAGNGCRRVVRGTEDRYAPHGRKHEIQGLRFWNGEPTVRLLDSDDEVGAMLLERCEPGTMLSSVPEPEQDVVISALLRRLWRPSRRLTLFGRYRL